MWKLSTILILLLAVNESFQGFAGSRDNTANENSTDNIEIVTEYDDDKTGDMGQFSQDPYPETMPTPPHVVSSSTTVYPETQPPPPYCLPLPKEERSVEAGLGWAAATAILIFAFSNTVSCFLYFCFHHINAPK